MMASDRQTSVFSLLAGTILDAATETLRLYFKPLSRIFHLFFRGSLGSRMELGADPEEAASANHGPSVTADTQFVPGGRKDPSGLMVPGVDANAFPMVFVLYKITRDGHMVFNLVKKGTGESVGLYSVRKGDLKLHQGDVLKITAHARNPVSGTFSKRPQTYPARGGVRPFGVEGSRRRNVRVGKAVEHNPSRIEVP